MIITTQHFRTIPGFSRRPGFWVRGGRAWFERYGLSWRDFLANGIESEKLLATGDAFAIAIVRHAEGTGHGQ